MRQHVAAYEIETGPRVPEKLMPAWSRFALGFDVLAVLSACYIAGMPAVVGPAACVVICGALASCGAYRISYAVYWRDEVYHAVLGVLIAALPLWALLHFVTGLSTPAVIVALVLAAALVGGVRAALFYARRGIEIRDHGCTLVSPEGQRRASDSVQHFVKRCFDVSAASAGIALTAPVWAAAAAAIAIESGFPILFLQERTGLGGKRFVMLKFRTMRTGAGSDWAKPSDRRITRVGAFLRRCSIDELPQLINVVRGDMSLVGPRPEMPVFAERFAASLPHYDERHMVRPGLTGWAQTHFKRNLQPDDVPNVLPYDLFYVENSSLVLDAVLVVKTAAEFLFHRAV